MADKRYRSALKAFSWRLTGTMDTVVISFFITGKISWALSIGGVELFTKLILYYLHERIWDRISIGRVRSAKKDDYQI